MKILYLTGIPSPYRVSYFNELAKKVDLHVIFEKNKADFRNEKWQNLNDIRFSYEVLKGIKTSHSSSLSFKTFKYVNKNKYDVIVLHGYSSLTAILLSIYLKLKGISFGVETDGMIKRKDNLLKKIVKTFILRTAKFHLCPGNETLKVLKAYGVNDEDVYMYPFTSVHKSEILVAPKSKTEKKLIREKLGIHYDKVLLCVGMMSNNNGLRKGYDTLIKASSKLGNNIGVYFVGEPPTDEFVDLVNNNNAKNVNFIGFKTKDELAQYYQMSDIFVLLTRFDIWGLVINEAMANGLPIITTTMCVAGKELIKDDVNGYLIEPEDESKFLKKVANLVDDEGKMYNMGHESLNIITNYTTEKMVEVHVDIFNRIALKG